MSKVVFVGNVPYNMGEEKDQLIDVFKSVGQVVGFRLVFDRDTGKPKGYGFCEFADSETAASAVRNLNNVDVGGRPLRIDLADSDPFLEGKTTVRGELMDSGGPIEPRSQRNGIPVERSAFMASIPPGIEVAPNSTSLDAISHFLATANSTQLTEVLAHMKAFVITHPEQARSLLVAHPQVAYALFQTSLLNEIVDPAILQRMLAATSMPPGAPGTSNGAPLPPPHLQQPPFPPPSQHQNMPPYPPPMQNQNPPGMNPMPPPSAMFSQPPLHGAPPAPYYRAPPPPVQPPVQTQPPPLNPNQTPEISSDHRAMLMQVLSLTPEQVSALPEQERTAIQQLRAQFTMAN